MTARRPSSSALPAESRGAATGHASGWAPALGVELAALLIGCGLSLAGLVGLAILTNGGLGSSVSTAGTVVVAAGAAGRPGTLSLGDLDAIARTVANIGVASRQVADSSGVVLTDTVPRAAVEGVDPSFAQFAGNSMTRGVFFTDQDASAASRVAVLGLTIAGSLFPNGQSPIGQTIRIRNLPFTVVGVLKATEPAGSAGANNAVLVPFQTGQVRLFGTRSVYEVVLQVRNANQASSVSNQVQQLLRRRHDLAAGQADDFTIQTGSASSSAGDLSGLETARRVVQLVQQYTCGAKSLCGATS